ncbi:Proteinaceous RNase P 2 [Platanthera guangdongensis]|uniref:Proteinaceous RNase P 2 n=1 Tax=Platanthera guangdongensis TaxID=2320717 RepID=A0ABR2N0W0_9ASPA
MSSPRHVFLRPRPAPVTPPTGHDLLNASSNGLPPMSDVCKSFPWRFRNSRPPKKRPPTSHSLCKLSSILHSPHTRSEPPAVLTLRAAVNLATAATKMISILHRSQIRMLINVLQITTITTNPNREWLDNHGSYEVVIDGANVAFYQQNFADGGFNLSQLDVVVGELQQRSQGKWPLIILHSKRHRVLMDNPANRHILERWSAAGALYTTPSGSNDDW